MSTAPVRQRLRDGTGPMAEALRRLEARPELSPEALERIQSRAKSGLLHLPRIRALSYAKIGGVGLAVIATFGLWAVIKARGDHMMAAAPELAARTNPVAVSDPAMPGFGSPPPTETSDPVSTPTLPAAIVASKRSGVGRARSVTKVQVPSLPSASNRMMGTSVQATGPGSTLAVEAGLIRDALEQLNVVRNPNRALEVLDNYDQQFRSGVFLKEAALTRIDALIAAGRHVAALEKVTEIETLVRADLPRSLELEILRGELLSRQGQCAEALRVLERLQPRVPTGPLDERLLVTRAKCLAMLGDFEGSHAELSLYLQRYPNGTLATDVRSELAE